MSQIKIQLQSHDVIYILFFYCFAQMWRQVSNLVQYFNLFYCFDKTQIPRLTSYFY